MDRAFAQIRAKGYADPYVATGKPIWLVGLSFDRETRKLVNCAAEPYRRSGGPRSAGTTEVREKCRRLPHRPEVSIRTALVHSGGLAASVEASGYFDAIVPLGSLPGF